VKRKRYELILHVGTHDWLRYGQTYEGELLAQSARGRTPRVRLFKPGDDHDTCEVTASSVREVD
jgi:hypothetical protein